MSGMQNDFNNPYAQGWPAARPQSGAPVKRGGSGAGAVIAIVLGVLLFGGCFLGAIGLGVVAIVVRAERERKQEATEEAIKSLRSMPAYPSANESMQDWNSKHEEQMRQMHEDMQQRQEEFRLQREEMMREMQRPIGEPPAGPDFTFPPFPRNP